MMNLRRESKSNCHSVRVVNRILLMGTQNLNRSTSVVVRGVGMVEVLVALVILSVGLLGTATMFVATMQAKTSALSRMHVVNLANDMADRIRANRTAGAAYAVADITALTVDPAKGCVDVTGTPAVSCSAADMAADDLFRWYSMVTGTLGAGVAGSITVDTATTPTTYTITFRWQEPTTGPLTHTLRLQI